MGELRMEQDVFCECGQRIAFVTTTLGNKMPVNLPSEKRVIMIDPADETGMFEMSDKMHGKALVVDTFRPHFATCPNAEKFRKGRQRD